MDTQQIEFKVLALPRLHAIRSADALAADGHALRADVTGVGASLGDPHVLDVTCLPCHPDDGGEPVERWPTLAELLAAADALTPGTVYALTFVAAPYGHQRPPTPDGSPRVLRASQVGQASLVADARSGGMGQPGLVT